MACWIIIKQSQHRRGEIPNFHKVWNSPILKSTKREIQHFWSNAVERFGISSDRHISSSFRRRRKSDIVKQVVWKEIWILKSFAIRGGRGGSWSCCTCWPIPGRTRSTCWTWWAPQSSLLTPLSLQSTVRTTNKEKQTTNIYLPQNTDHWTHST